MGILSQLILPVGFSYYIFQAIAYLIDILKGKVKAEKNLLFFALYMCFFPKFISGPIEEPYSLLPQIKQLNRVYMKDDHKLSIAFPTILYGLFMKVVVADRLDLYSPALRNEDYQYDWLLPNVLGMRFSLNKLEMLNVSAERFRIKDFFVDILRLSYYYYYDSRSNVCRSNDGRSNMIPDRIDTKSTRG